MTRCWRWMAAGIALVAPAGCTARGEKTAQAHAAPKPVVVTVAPLEYRTVERTVDVVGSLRGWEHVTVGAKLPASKVARVVKVLHDIGDHVAPGEPLVELDPVDADLEIHQAESKYLGELVKLGITRDQAELFLKRFGISEKLLRGEEADRLVLETPAVIEKRVALERARQNLARERQLNARGAGTAQDLQNTENDLRAAEAAYENAIVTARTVIANAVAARVALDVARQARADMIIRAPEPRRVPQGLAKAETITFAVTQRDVTEGQMLKQGDAVAELVIPNPLKLWANVPERYSAEVAVDQLVRITVSAYPDKVFEGRVTRINPAVDATSRTFAVEVAVPNDEGLLRPGGFAKAAIVTHREAQATTVPLAALVTFAGVTKIFIVESGDKVRAIPVATGLEGPGWIEVTGPLPAQAQVVTTGQTQLADGTAIVIRKPEANKDAGARSPNPTAPLAQADPNSRLTTLSPGDPRTSPDKSEE
jgi:membrane fusion protein (multidrug efflux system)